MEDAPRGPYCGVVSSILLFAVVFVVLQWLGAGLLGLNAGGTMVGAILIATIGVHIYCTYRLEHKRRAMGG